MKVVLSPNPFRDKGLKAAQAAERVLRSAGVETVMCLPFELEKGSVELPRNIRFKDAREELRTADILICFGGDGTILHAAKDANAFHVPVLGVNLGSVGFMAELEQGELSVLNRLASGKYAVEERMMLDVTVRREGKTVYTDLALNDAAVTKGAVARVVDLEVYGDWVLISALRHVRRRPHCGAYGGEHHRYPHLPPRRLRPVLCAGPGADGGGEAGEDDPQDRLPLGGRRQGLSSEQQRHGGAAGVQVQNPAGAGDRAQLL